MKKGQKKGISLVIVVVICFVLTLTVTTGFTVVCRYMSMAQKSVETLRTELVTGQTQEG